MYFLVDFENVGSNGLRGTKYLNKDDAITIFFSVASHCCEQRYLEEIEQSECRFDICKLQKAGKNALDFYIATRIGEFYGSGKEDRVAIISKDNGFKALQDYWRIRLPADKKLILSPSIESGLVASKENSVRVRELKRKRSVIDIEIFQMKYVERRKLRESLERILGETDYLEQLSEIQNMIETRENLKTVYLNSLHQFGKKQGLEIYRLIKPVL